MKRSYVLAYGVAAYALFFVSFLLFGGFLTNIAGPKTIDSEPVAGAVRSFFVNTALILLFALQHLVMARSAFKGWLTRVVPEPVERSTFVAVASLLLILICLLWHPIPANIWNIDNPILATVSWAGFILGFGLIVYSSFLIDHWDLFGLRQVYLYFKNRPYNPVPFKVHSLYRHVRHPMMLGFLMMLWSTPEMSVGRLTMAVELSAFIFVGIWLEERELKKTFGRDYLDYRAKTSMVIPKGGRAR